MSSAVRNACVLCLLLGLLVWAGATPAAEEKLERTVIAKRAKPATAFLQTKSATGTGFCVHSSGLFLTTEHLVRERLAEVTLVLDTGSKTQKTLKAKVIRSDKNLDLALLRVVGEEKFEALPLGTDDKLSELDEVIALGFPFGTAITKSGEYPAVTVNAGSVTSLRRDKDGLARIQLDAALNEGNSGGPVLDRSGKVVGVVVSGVRGAGVNMAIPVSHVLRFLNRPELTLRLPTVAAKGKHLPAEFRVGALVFATPPKPLELELILTNSSGAERKFPMKAAGEMYTVKAVPFPESKVPASVRIRVTYGADTVIGATEDREVSIGKQTVPLSDITELTFGTTATAVLRNGKKLDGAVTGLDSLSLTLGGKSVPVKLTEGAVLSSVPGPPINAVGCVVVARSAGKELSRHAAVLYLEGTDRATLEAIRNGRFVRPVKAAGSTTYLKVASSEGDPIGEGKSYSYQGSELKASVITSSPRGTVLEIRTGKGRISSDWKVVFAPPRGRPALKVGEYADAKRYPFNDDSPGLSFSGHGRGSNTLTGKFVIWEMELDGKEIVKLAVDFFQQSEGKNGPQPPLCGMLRVNSTFD